MSAFGNFLSQVLAQRRHADPAFNQKRLAVQLGITPAMLSRFLAGESADCNRSTLRKIQNGLADEDTQAEMLASYLRDQIGGPGSSRVRVEVDGASARIMETPPDAACDAARGLDPCTQTALRTISRHCAESRGLRRVVRELGGLAKELEK